MSLFPPSRPDAVPTGPQPPRAVAPVPVPAPAVGTSTQARSVRVLLCDVATCSGVVHAATVVAETPGLVRLQVGAAIVDLTRDQYARAVAAAVDAERWTKLAAARDARGTEAR